MGHTLDQSKVLSRATSVLALDAVRYNALAKSKIFMLTIHFVVPAKSGIELVLPRLIYTMESRLLGIHIWSASRNCGAQGASYERSFVTGRSTRHIPKAYLAKRGCTELISDPMTVERT